MSKVRYVTLDPTGNITCLVTDTAGRNERTITQRLMKECEQVAYLLPPTLPGSRAKVRLMGGEFCGNAAMASACWLADREGMLTKGSVVYPLEMSGMSGIMQCQVRTLGDEYEGTVPMPPVREIRHFSADGLNMTAVRLEGIVHMILNGPPFPDDHDAEQLLRDLAESWEEEAVGLLEWNESEMTMRPLVLVKGSDTLVWETGCGSGSASIGAYRASLCGKGTVVTDVRQPGGTIRAAADFNGQARNLTITGKVRFGPERELNLDEP